MYQLNPLDKIELPVLIPFGGLTPESFIAYYHAHGEQIQEILFRMGAIKFQNIYINSLFDFQHIVDAISDKFLNYIDGNSPRTKLSGHVYTSTEYDKSRRITMHNELSYSAKWPQKLFFSCIQPSETGGETLLADSREILEFMNKDIVSEISRKGITYIRNLHGGTGMGPSWQDTFETTDKKRLEAYCQAYSINYEWVHGDMLKLKQFASGIIQHRQTKESLWFNQIDQFHPYHLGEELFETLQALYSSPENFPLYVTYGDGTAIDEGSVKEILDTIEDLTLAPVWNRNELLIVDNERVCHGRNSYTGERRVLVAMSE